jgi:F0F1-type ATP synthase assembly protein I
MILKKMEEQTTQKEQKDRETKQSGSSLSNYAKYTGLGLQMVIIILITVWGGIKLDELFLLETPVFTIILSLVGVAAAIYTAIKDFIR